MMSPPLFPIEPEGLLGTWTFNDVPKDRTKIEGFAVTAAEIAHKGGRTLGYRVEDDTGSFAYLPDHAPSRGLTRAARELIDGVVVLLHDAQFAEAERAIADDYGNATVSEAIELAVHACVKTLVLFHHSPARTDADLDLLGQDLESPLPVIIARGNEYRPAVTGRSGPDLFVDLNVVTEYPDVDTLDHWSDDC